MTPEQVGDLEGMAAVVLWSIRRARAVGHREDSWCVTDGGVAYAYADLLAVHPSGMGTIGRTCILFTADEWETAVGLCAQLPPLDKARLKEPAL